MRAIVMTAAGGADVLVEQDVPTPTPAAGQILVKAGAIGVHFAETQLRSGIFPMSPTPPVVFGSEAAGTVTDAGPGVDPRLIGARVIVTTDGTGAYAEQVVASAATAVRVPDDVPLTDAVATAVPGAVALTLLRAAAMDGHESVLVEAASTGVGAYLLQMAKEFGAARVFATAGTDTNGERAKLLGADEVFVHSTPGWQDAMRGVLGDTTIDVAFESIGGETATGLLDAMTPLSGRMLSYGLLSGRPAAISAQDLMFRGLTFTGCGGPAWLERVAAARAEILERVSAGSIRPLVDSVIPLAHAHLAHEKIEQRKTSGKVILDPTA
ncbi:zinc-binding dehydrogenase [Rhodococcus spelaei]|uniref:Zinc-binding dehydrogenase n=1 Tax=Rhodococcus spelaei TaxID=2546320 RepID=A0A541BPG4_9NOCA|nr:zinc-binding dehydrogenase [Rhodococcus spelaei]TQF74216.1 zinc-binding dehydrogenase [Rhodococcus spelaei]